MNDDRNANGTVPENQPEAAQTEEKKPFVLQQDADFAFEKEAEPDEKARRKAERKARKKAAKASGRRGGSLLYVSVVLLVSVLLAAGIFMVLQDSLALMKSSDDTPVEIEIAQGDSTAEIAQQLKEKKVISYPFFFRLYMKAQEGSSLHYGIYELHPHMSYAEVRQALSEVHTFAEAVEVTIPEGFTLIKIADLLEQKGIIADADAFVKYTDTHLDELVGDHGDLIPTDAGRFLQAEGFLFPDTYDFYPDSSDRRVAKTLVDHFFDVVEPHMEEIQAGMKKSGLSFLQTISLASVIQKESSDAGEMPRVSGVFANRLKNPLVYPRLESNPTRDYANNVVAKEGVVAVKKMVDSYNTYVCNGVPAGPICSPGLDAILAAAKPDQHSYFFFVTDKENRFYYSETYEEHQKICWKLGYQGV